MPRKIPHPLPEPPGQLQLPFASVRPNDTKLPDPPPHDPSAPAMPASTRATRPAASPPALASGTSARRAVSSKSARPGASRPVPAAAKAAAKNRGKRHRANRRAAGMVRVEVEMSRAARKQLTQLAHRLGKSLRQLGGEMLAGAPRPAA